MWARRFAKLAVGAASLVLLTWLFFHTLQDTIAQPYDARGVEFSGWTLASRDQSGRGPAMLVLEPPQRLLSVLFDQLFDRTMASMTTPGDSAVPIVLRSELQGEAGIVLSPDEILAAARTAGVGRAPLDPVCMAVKRQPFAGRTREFYFVVFDSPEVLAFRRQLNSLAAERGVAGAFDDPGFELVLPVAGSDPGFDSWWPLVVDRETDCLAPVE